MDTTLLAGIIGLVGALIGGAIGGFGGYYGGVQGAKTNSELVAAQNKEIEKRLKQQALQTLMDQIWYTYDYLINGSKYLVIQGLIYDTDWHKHLALCDQVSPADKKLIIDWFREINNVEGIAGWMATQTGTSALGRLADRPDKMYFKVVQDKLSHISPGVKDLLERYNQL